MLVLLCYNCVIGSWHGLLAKNTVVSTCQSNRGCRAACTFCNVRTYHGKTVRHKTIDSVVDELLCLQNDYGVQHIVWLDDDLFYDVDRTLNLYNEIVKQNLNITWDASNGIIASAAVAHPELISAAEESGCIGAYFGIESGNEEVRKDANRTSDTNSAQIEKVKLLEKTGIKVKAMYIIGMPADTDSSYKKTVEFAKKVKSSYAQFSVFTPYPGTPIFKEYEKKITAKKYENFTQWQLVFNHPNFKPIDILNLLNYSYQQYYLNPKWMVHFTLNKIKETYENLYHRIFGFSR